ncbi:NSS family neurotransmitter:Na+ symporter [Breoghania corrubedonensis]|uniref:Transporter n=1 Tax=Breoghania corrubedonensis TaxID=665038 RepID=A0A2T5VE91_9HYPH|nr:sodium-dependent transporter [Breoghania corrubedonensis]PTW62070.1 NSS family neurotransmitter:Na+ symporter [Breoghania corrubedonensis]
MNAPREKWHSRIGFIVAAAGSAVGLGNIWKFPYITGENGGAAFLLLYLAIVFTLGLSLLLAEVAVGRASQSDALSAFQVLGHRGWTVVGAIGLSVAFLILSFYSVIAGWTIAYVIKSADGAFTGLDIGGIGNSFADFISDPWQPLIYQAVFVALTVFVVLKGVASGIERVSKILMPLLFVILLALVARSLTLPGAQAGVDFFLSPDFSKINGSVFMAALGQAFFSLSIGMSAMLTYGSYIDRETRIGRSAWYIVSLDTLVAVLAGLAILPAVFAFGLDPKAGPALTFITLPTVFQAMPGGAIFGPAFFVLLLIAALTSSVSLLEPLVALFRDRGFARAPTTIAIGSVTFLLGIPSSLSQGVWADFKLFGMSFLDLLDFLTSNIMLPISGLMLAIFVGWVMGPRAADEVTMDGEHPGILLTLWIFILRFVAPLAILAILINGLM